MYKLPAFDMADRRAVVKRAHSLHEIRLHNRAMDRGHALSTQQSKVENGKEFHPGLEGFDGKDGSAGDEYSSIIHFFLLLYAQTLLLPLLILPFLPFPFPTYVPKPASMTMLIRFQPKVIAIHRYNAERLAIQALDWRLNYPYPCLAIGDSIKIGAVLKLL